MAEYIIFSGNGNAVISESIDSNESVSQSFDEIEKVAIWDEFKNLLFDGNYDKFVKCVKRGYFGMDDYIKLGTLKVGDKIVTLHGVFEIKEISPTIYHPITFEPSRAIMVEWSDGEIRKIPNDEIICKLQDTNENGEEK